MHYLSLRKYSKDLGEVKRRIKIHINYELSLTY